MYLEQLRHFFDNLGRQDMDNNLVQASRSVHEDDRIPGGTSLWTR